MPPKLLSTTTTLCRKCNTNVKDAVACPGCGSSYHRSCAASVRILPNNSFAKCCGSSRSRSPSPSGSQNDIAALSNDIKALTLHITQGFDKVNQTLDAIKNDIVDHRSRISTVETTLSDVVVRLDEVEKVSCTNSSEYILSEVERRLKAKLSVVLFNLSEPVINNTYNLANDNLMISEFFKIINFSFSPLESLKIFRVGKFSTSRPKPRPLKLQFTSSNLASEFLNSARKATAALKLDETFSNVTFTADRTRLQQDQYRALKSTLKERQDQGETNLIIRHVNGTPTIVPFHPSVNNLQQLHNNLPSITRTCVD